VRALFQSLFSRAEKIDALAKALPAQILANRTKREASPAALTKSAKRTVRSFEKDSTKAALDSGSAGFGYGIALMFMGFLAAASGHGTSVIIGLASAPCGLAENLVIALLGGPFLWWAAGFFTGGAWHRAALGAKRI
jgi:hypothetical protein